MVYYIRELDWELEIRIRLTNSVIQQGRRSCWDKSSVATLFANTGIWTVKISMETIWTVHVFASE